MLSSDGIPLPAAIASTRSSYGARLPSLRVDQVKSPQACRSKNQQAAIRGGAKSAGDRIVAGEEGNETLGVFLVLS